MKSSRYLPTILILLIAFFCNAISLRAEEGNDGLYHDIINTSNALIIPSCKNYYFTGKISTYNLFISSSDYHSGSFVFVSHQAHPCGLVTTSSNGRVKSVKLGCSYDKDLDPGVRCFYIYGKNTPYASTDDLADDATRGELIGTIDKSDSSPDFNIKSFSGNQQYKYIAISASAPYLDYFDIAWEDSSDSEPYTRTNVPAKSLGTICLPYAVRQGGIDGILVFELEGKVTEGGEVKEIVFSEVDEMEAGMPYFYYFPGDEAGSFTLSQSGDPVLEAKHKNGLYGTFSDFPFSSLQAASEGNVYVVNSSNELQRAGAESGVYANRAYVVMAEVNEMDKNSPSSNTRMVLSADGFTFTENLTTLASGECSTLLEQPLYTISGRRVNSGQTGKDVVISKSKKFIPSSHK